MRIDRSTSQHLQLPGTIAEIARKYGDKVDIQTYDNSSNPPREVPLNKIDTLRDNGSECDLLGEQQRHLDTLYSRGTIDRKLYKDLSRRSQ